MDSRGAVVGNTAPVGNRALSPWLIFTHIFGCTRGWVHSAPTGRPSKAQAIGLGQKVHPISGSQALKGRDKDYPPASTTVRVDPRTLYRPFRAYGQMGMGSRTQAVCP
jgi:hypothetical protein